MIESERGVRGGAPRSGRLRADVAELADALDLGSSSERSGGSSPLVRTSSPDVVLQPLLGRIADGAGLIARAGLAERDRTARGGQVAALGAVVSRAGAGNVDLRVHPCPRP